MLQKHVFNFLILITTESFKTISNIKKKIKNQKFISEDKRSRSASRLVAIQVLYNYFLLDENIEDIIAKYTLSFESDLNDLFYINNFDREYFQNLIDEFLKNDKQLEKEINSIVKNDWDLGRMSIIDRAILYIGLIEIKIMKKTSKKVIISEYVEMAYQLGGESGFINYSLEISSFIKFFFRLSILSIFINL